MQNIPIFPCFLLAFWLKTPRIFRFGSLFGVLITMFLKFAHFLLSFLCSEKYDIRHEFDSRQEQMGKWENFDLVFFGCSKLTNNLVMFFPHIIIRCNSGLVVGVR